MNSAIKEQHNVYATINSPLQYYLDIGKAEHERYVNAYFDVLKNQAKVDEEKNARTVESYDKKQKEIFQQETQISKYKRKRGWGIFGIIVLGLALMFILGAMGTPPVAMAILCVLTIAGVIVGIVSLCKKTGAKIKSLQSVVNALQKDANALKQEAFSQVEPLIQLFTDFDGLKLFETAFPQVKFDDFISLDRLQQLKNYGYNGEIYDRQSVLDVVSGSMYGAPLLYERRTEQRDGTKTYHGSLHITWSESYTDSQGNRQTRMRSQTLHASVTKFAPYYTDVVKLHYGQDVKPELCFSRQGKDAHRKDEEGIERTVRKGEKKLQRKHDKALKKGENFTPLANAEFEVLFGATDRTDELAFRYLFTASAQQNMLELIRSSEGYGDDFDFYKSGKLNTIVSDHAQYDSVFPKVRDYASYSFKDIEKNFKTANQNFFKKLYFDIAPLIAIPCYQQPLVESKKVETGGFSNHVYQIMARLLGKDTNPSNVETNVIYNTGILERQDGADIVSVRSCGYYTEQRTDYVPVFGGDGHMHSVPVDWDEYIPIDKTSTIKVWATDGKEGEASYLGVTASFIS